MKSRRGYMASITTKPHYGTEVWIGDFRPANQVSLPPEAKPGITVRYSTISIEDVSHNKHGSHAHPQIGKYKT